MTLLPNEDQQTTLFDDTIVLTNQRIQLAKRSWDSAHSVTMFLEDISSIEKSSRNNITLLILGILLLGAAVVAYLQGLVADQTQLAIILTTAIVMIILWLASIQHIIKISSKGGSSINIVVGGNKKEQVDSFIDQVLLAKGGRIIQLHKL